MKALVHATLRAALFAVLIPSDAGASWVGMRLPELLTESDEIVVATLQNAHGSLRGGYEVSEGELVVERVVCGAARPGETLTLRWKSPVNSRPENERYEGRPQLWLLTREPDGSVRADHPQRVMPLEEAATVLDTLATYPYRVIAPDRDPGEPAIMSIRFRNATSADIAIPAFRTGNGHLVHGDSFGLIVWQAVFDDAAFRGSPRRLAPDESLRYDPAVRADILAPGMSKQVGLSLTELFGALPSGAYSFVILVNGRRTDHRFVVRTGWGSRYHRVRDTPEELAFCVQTLRERAPESSQAVSLIRLQGENGVTVAGDLMAMCDSLETDVRCRVIALVAGMNLEAETRLEFLLDRIDDPVPAVSRAAWAGVCQILGNQSVHYRRDEVIDRLITQLDDEDQAVRSNAVNALASIKATYAVPLLKNVASNDADAGVRRNAAAAIDRIEGRERCCTCDETLP